MVDQNIAGYSLGMSLATAELPDDMVSLRAFALACQSEFKVAELSVEYKALEIEKLKLQIAKLRRMQFGRSSERITRQIEQLELRLKELETGEAEAAAKTEAQVDIAEPVAPIRCAPNRSASRCRIICRARRSCISLPMTAPVSVPTAARAWPGWART
jgi:aconitase B